MTFERAWFTYKFKYFTITGFFFARALWDVDLVRDLIRKHPWNGKRKNNASFAYRDWCRWKGFEYVVEKAILSLKYLWVQKQLTTI